MLPPSPNWIGPEGQSGWQGSNLRHPAPKADALPLRYIPSDPLVCASSGVPELSIGGVVNRGGHPPGPANWDLVAPFNT